MNSEKIGALLSAEGAPLNLLAPLTAVWGLEMFRLVMGYFPKHRTIQFDKNVAVVSLTKYKK